MDEKTKEVHAKNRKERIDIQHMFNHLCHNALVWGDHQALLSSSNNSARSTY